MLYLLKVKKVSVALLSLWILTALPVTSLATSGNEDTAKKESVKISSKIDGALQSANEKYQELETLKSEVTSTKSHIEETKTDIEETEASIKKRTDVMAGRMKDIQANGASFNLFESLLDAENMSDFINRVYAVTVLQGAEKTKVESLASDKEKLEALKTDLETNEESLIKKQQDVETDTAVLEKEVSALKVELADNEDLLNKLATERIAKEAQEKKAKFEKEKEVAEAKKVEATKQTSSTSKQTSQSASTESTESSNTQPETQVSKPAQPAPSQPSTGGGSTMTMEATGYSYSEPGLGFYTATGIDLRQNPQVIAVDPSVIPLNSLVEVSGYGFAIAGDTGGAIKGNRIDLHFKTVQECFDWGRRSVSVTVK